MAEHLSCHPKCCLPITAADDTGLWQDGMNWCCFSWSYFVVRAGDFFCPQQYHWLEQLSFLIFQILLLLLQFSHCFVTTEINPRQVFGNILSICNPSSTAWARVKVSSSIKSFFRIRQSAALSISWSRISSFCQQPKTQTDVNSCSAKAKAVKVSPESCAHCLN